VAAHDDWERDHEDQLVSVLVVHTVELLHRVLVDWQSEGMGKRLLTVFKVTNTCLLRAFEHLTH
jgi:hypothetical protein